MGILVIIILVVIVIWFFNKQKAVENVKSNWHHTFDDLQFSTQEFYQKVEEAVKKREVPGVSISRISYSQTGLLSSKREYLRVTRNEFVFDICAAPFGKAFFVSWWLGETFESPLEKIPVLNILTGKDRKHKSYYQLDTELMFRGSIQAAFLDAVDQMTTAKGIRALSELDRRENNVENKSGK